MDEQYSGAIPAKSRYPPGYRFMPTDSELILEYLRKKIDDEPIPIAEINETNFKQVDPMDLTAKYPKVGDNEWYFFTPRDRKYPNGARPDRGSKSGYWKATGADKAIKVGDEIVGYRKALVFYQGKPQKGQKTNWIMHEFRANGPAHHKTTPNDMRLDDWVLCRIYEKSTRVTNKRKHNNDPSEIEIDESSGCETPSSQSTAVDVAVAVAVAVADPNPNYHPNQEEKVVNKFENLPIENPYSYNYCPEPMINNDAAAFGLGEWPLLQMPDPLLTNLDAGMLTPLNAFGNPYFNQQPQPSSSSWTNNNNEAFFPSYYAPTNSTTNFSPFYSQADAHQDKGFKH